MTSFFQDCMKNNEMDNGDIFQTSLFSFKTEIYSVSKHTLKINTQRSIIMIALN